MGHIFAFLHGTLGFRRLLQHHPGEAISMYFYTGPMDSGGYCNTTLERPYLCIFTRDPWIPEATATRPWRGHIYVFLHGTHGFRRLLQHDPGEAISMYFYTG